MTASPLEVELPAAGILGVSGRGTIEVADDHVEIRGANASVTLKFSAIDGVDCDGRKCMLYTRHGPFELRGNTALGQIEREIIARAGALPGVTRALRAMGSHRGAPGAQHDAFFAPLLAARRRAERAVDGAVRLAAFEGAALKRGVETAILELARQRYPAHPAARRAAEEELLELVEPLLAACERLGLRASAVRSAEPEVVVARWREWTQDVQSTFEIADRAWMRLSKALDQPIRERRSLWKRILPG